MGIIKILDREVSELIAAGEVVERPASVVKELVENSIDAKATTINLDIIDGGKTLIRVVDNGIGMCELDCKLAFLKHATSKVSLKEDLENINTLGFRGEALASICSVSKVEVTTKERNSETGVRYVIKAGGEESLEEVNCSDGTTIEVRDIFYNVPGRLKFLKKDSTEAGVVCDVFERLAISNAGIAFGFRRNGKKIFQTSGDGNLGNVIYELFGKEFFKTLISVNYCSEDVKIEGFVSSPNNCRLKNKIQYCFVNSRYVKSRVVSGAVNEAFKGFKLVGNFPAFFIFIFLPSSCFDVNVHPAKTEIRFVDDSKISRLIFCAVRFAVHRASNVFEIDRENGNFKEKVSDLDSSVVNGSFDQFSSETKPYEVKGKEQLENRFLDKTVFENLEFDCFAPDSKKGKAENLDVEVCLDDFNEDSYSNEDGNFKSLIFCEDGKVESLNLKEEAKEKKDYYIKVVGEIFKTYILAEAEGKFVIIDKHAAHERIIFENLKKAGSKLERQILIKPMKVVLNSNEDCELVLSNSKVFEGFGFLVEDFGNHCILIREVPAVLCHENCSEVFEEIFENFKKNRNSVGEGKLDEIYYKIACRAAVKASDDNSLQQLEVLAKEVYFNNSIRRCPHGRPVVLTFSKERFDKEFGRLG